LGAAFFATVFFFTVRLGARLATVVFFALGFGFRTVFLAGAFFFAVALRVVAFLTEKPS